MAYEQRDNTGSLFRNDRKNNEKSPDYNGSCLIGGREYWINGWVKESKSGKKFFSFAFKEKEERKVDPAPSKTTDLDDDVPF
jgi:uncharacterized protein (DUF736 family)